MNIRKSEFGGLNILLVPLILSVLFFFGALGFGAWAYMERQDYKNNSDKKADTAAKIAAEKTKTAKDNEFIEREKEPLRDYKGLASLGSITFKYPKTWSAQSKDSDTELSLIMHPLVVSGNAKSIYALRVEVVNQPYDNVVDDHESNIKNGKLKASPYALKTLPSIVGLRVDGQLTNEKNGSMIILPLRDKTLRISTESKDFMGDFDSIILPNFTFSP